MNDREGGFAYEVPPGWELIDNPLGRYSSMFRFKMAVDKKTNARIAVTVGYGWTLLTMAEQRDSVVMGLYTELTPAELKTATQSIVETPSKQRGIRLFFSRKTQGTFVHQWIYFFSRRDKIVVQVHCIAPADPTYDRAIESAMRTFRISR